MDAGEAAPTHGVVVAWQLRSEIAGPRWAPDVANGQRARNNPASPMGECVRIISRVCGVSKHFPSASCAVRAAHLQAF
jgi:hypothetical protein